MKILNESENYRLLETKEIEFVGNYQIVSIVEIKAPYIFDDYEDALKKFDKLTKG